MLQMVDGIEDGGLSVFAEETVVEGHLHDTARLSQASHLFVGEVAGMVAQGTTGGMCADDGRLRDFEGIEEALVAGMTQVDHQSETVHLADDLFAETAYAAMYVAAAAGVAEVVVAVVAEGDIDHAALSEMADVL